MSLTANVKANDGIQAYSAGVYVGQTRGWQRARARESGEEGEVFEIVVEQTKHRYGEAVASN